MKPNQKNAKKRLPKWFMMFGSLMCYIIFPLALAIVGFPMFFSGLEKLDALPLMFGTSCFILVVLIPIQWTKELQKEGEN